MSHAVPKVIVRRRVWRAKSSAQKWLSPCWLSQHWASVINFAVQCSFVLRCHLSAWPEPRDIQILPPPSAAGQPQTLMGRTTQKDFSLSGFCILVRKEQLYFHSFRFSSHHRYSQHCWHLKRATLLNMTSWLAVHFFSADLLLRYNLCQCCRASSHKQWYFFCPGYSQISVAFGTHYTWRRPSPHSNQPHHAHLGQPAAPLPLGISTSEKLLITIWLVVTQVSFHDKNPNF